MIVVIFVKHVGAIYKEEKLRKPQYGAYSQITAAGGLFRARGAQLRARKNCAILLRRRKIAKNVGFRGNQA